MRALTALNPEIPVFATKELPLPWEEADGLSADAKRDVRGPGVHSLYYLCRVGYSAECEAYQAYQ